MLCTTVICFVFSMLLTLNVWVFHPEQFSNSLQTPTGALQSNSILTQTAGPTGKGLSLTKLPPTSDVTYK